MAKVYVAYKNNIVFEEREYEDFGSWEEDYLFLIDRVSVSPGDDSNRYREDAYDVAGEIVPNQSQVYVLSVTYSTGDSFGRATGQGEVVWTFANVGRAEAAYQAWLAEWSNLESEPTVEFLTDMGEAIRYINPGYGYFNQLTEVNLESFVVTE